MLLYSNQRWRYNNANVVELESKVFIVVGWACEGCKTTKFRRQPFQSTYLRALAHKDGAGLDQTQLSLEHASIQTTERYLGVEQDLTDAPCDHLGLRLE